MKKAYLAIKFHEGVKSKKQIEDITEALKKVEIEDFVMIRDMEKWGEIKMTPESLMQEYTFPEIDKCDMMIVDLTEKGVGVGIEAGYAYARNIPIYVIAKKGSDISNTMAGIAKAVIFYESPEEITKGFKKIFERQNMPIILASKSKVRKQMLEKHGIDFQVRVSNADEEVSEELSLEEKYKAISSKKAYKVMEETKGQGDRIIVAADTEIVFDGVSYGKPKTIDDARNIIKEFLGKDVYAYTGNTILVIKNEMIEEKVCETDYTRIHVNEITDEELESYLNSVNVCSICGGINIDMTPFIYVVSGRKSTAEGMTMQFLKDVSFQGK